jgi:hypothetical protein
MPHLIDQPRLNGASMVPVRHAPQRPYSRDIGPCDFFLFGDLKTKSKGEELDTGEDLPKKIQGALRQIARGRLQ